MAWIPSLLIQFQTTLHWDYGKDLFTQELKSQGSINSASFILNSLSELHP